MKIYVFITNTVILLCWLLPTIYLSLIPAQFMSVRHLTSEKLTAYRKEVSGRLNIAETISNVIEGILMEQERTS